MKFKKTSIFLVSLLSLLTSCGNKSIAGTYGFQMGKEKGTHFGFSLTLTEEASTIEGVPSDAKKCEFSFSLGAKEGEDADSLIAIVSMIASALESEGKSLTFPAYYDKGEKVSRDGEQELKLGFDLTKIKNIYNAAIADVEDAPAFPEITPDKVEKIVYTTYLDNKVTLYIPVGGEDLFYQLYWYGIDINTDTEGKIVFNDSPYGVHDEGTHPTAEDVKAINETHNYAAVHETFFKNLELSGGAYRDYYTLAMGLLKQ